MRKIYLLLLLSTNIIYAQNGGFSDITGINILDENNYQSFVASNDLNDFLLNGWSIPGVIQVKIFVNGSSEGSASPTNGVWEENVDVSEGFNEAYLEITCNSSCSPSISTTTPITFNYIKPFETNEFAIFDISGTTDVEIDWSESRGYVPRNTNFYYRVWRNTEEVLSGSNFTAITSWTEDRSYIDTSQKQSNTTYYYWIEVAINDQGNNRSGIVVNNSGNISFGTLNNEEINAIESVIYPNPTKDKIHIKSKNFLSNGNWSLLTLSGKKIISNVYSITNDEVIITLPLLVKGVYLLQFETTRGFINERVIIN